MAETVESPFRQQRLIAAGKATFAVTVWGASFIATKVALRDVSPVTVVWLRFGIGVLILGAAVAVRRQFALLSAGQQATFALLGFLGVTFHQWLQSTGLVTSQASTTGWIVASTPIFIVLLGWLLLKERLTMANGMGIFLAAAGVLLVVSEGNLALLASGRLSAPGDVLILLSAPNWAIFSVLSRRGLRNHPAARMMLYVMAYGWLFSSLLFFARSNLAEIGQLSAPGWLGIAFLGIFCSGLAYIFWYDALQEIPAAQVGAFLYLEPLVAVLVAALVLQEAFYWASLLGGAAILSGVWLANRPR